MSHAKTGSYIFPLLILMLAGSVHAQSGPFDGTSFKGRIAFSSDGNYNDEDDWGAFPMAVAMLDSFGVKDRLVHVDYCNILPKNDTRFYREMVTSVLGAADRYKIDRSILFDCQTDLEAAIQSITEAINASSVDNRLYYVLAGPMEVPFQGIMKSDPDKRQYVYCISHSGWNDGYTQSDSALHIHNKRDVIPSGIHWIQCKDGNKNLAHPGGVGKRSTPQQWALYHWLRDSTDPNLRWIFTRLEAEGRADISDSTMTYFLLTGDEDADLPKLRSLLDLKKIPRIAGSRSAVRIEAENFRDLESYSVTYSDRRASHRLCVALGPTGAGSIGTLFNDIYTTKGVYDVEVRYLDERQGQSRLELRVNQIPVGAAWRASKDDNTWQTHTIQNVVMGPGDSLEVRVKGQGRESGKLDYVQLNLKGTGGGSSLMP